MNYVCGYEVEVHLSVLSNYFQISGAGYLHVVLITKNSNETVS